MKHRFIFLLSVTALTLGCSRPISEKAEFFPIKKQKIDFSGLIGDEKSNDSLVVNAFEISEFISYGEYKEYLKDIKRDSSKQFYFTQLPDSTMCLPNCYESYVSSSQFDTYPVVGISWEAAMEYCKWRTLKENTGEKIKFIYRLPSAPEWVAAYASSNKPLDMNQDYSDWLINSKNEWYWSSNRTSTNPLNYVLFAKKEDLKVLKRKVVIGNSFLFQQEKLIDFYGFSYYSFEGYRHVSFRIVKDDLIRQEHTSLADRVLKNWNLK